MRTICTTILLFLVYWGIAFSQSCLPEGITFTSQSQVDSFSVLYPNCTEIEGNLILNDTDSTKISNLNALSNLTKINGSLNVISSLEELSGLDNIVEIGGTLAIIRNEKLTNILSLKNLKKVNGSLTISTNSALANLAGLNNLISIGSNLTIRGNDVLEEITNLQTLTAINGDLTIWGNAVLNSLRGLDNISHTTINSLEIGENPLLAECNTNTICRYLNEDGAYYYLLNNAFGCSAVENILEACTVTPNVDIYYNNITISTEWTKQYLNIDGLLKEEQYQIINISGELIEEGVIHSSGSISLHNMTTGIYLLVLIHNDVNLKTSSFVKF